MKFKIHHPKLLAIVLLGIVGVSSAVALYAAQNGREAEPPAAVFPAVPVSAELTQQQGQEAIDIVKNSGIVKSISGGQDWNAYQISRASVGGKEAVKMKATWANPTTSSGPWHNAVCQSTLKVVSTNEFTDVTTLHLYVLVEEKEVVAVAIGFSPEDEPGAISQPIQDDMKVEVYEYKTGNLTYDGRFADWDPKCPEGTHDD